MAMDYLFGTAYYPEYMPYDRIEKDFEMMKKAGMNVVRIAESTWSTLEPEEGVFDFSWVDRVLAEAEKQGLKVIIGTPTYAVPSWLAAKDPDVLVTTEQGRARYGRRQLINLWSPVFLEHAERVIRKLVEHTAKNPSVIGFQIDNETKHYGNFGKEIQRQFVTYLKEKFRTTEALNRAFYLAYWSNSIHSWEDFPDMTGCINGGLASEFEAFKRKRAADYLAWQASILSEYKRADQFITHNLDFEWKKFGAEIAQDGYSYGVQPDIRHFEVSRCLTMAGADIYHPTQDDLTGAETAFCGDEIRSLKDAPYLVLECQAQAFKYWTPYPGQLRLQAYSHLAGGAAGLLYWNWHSIHNGYEAYWRGLLSHDLKENEAFREAAVIGREWQKNQERLRLVKKKNAVALVIDNRSLDALKWYPADRDLSYNDIVRWMYDCLFELNIECDVVDAEGLEPDRYRMIVTPALYCADQELLYKLKNFVRDGGVLVSSFRSFVADEHLSIYPETLPYILHECLGMSYQQFTEPVRTKIKGKPVSYFAELLVPDGAECLAAYEHPYWKKYAGITANSFGKGRAYYIGCYTEKDVLKELLVKAVHDAGIQRAALEQGLTWPVIVREGENSLGKMVHYLLHYSENEEEIRCPFERVQDILTGTVYEKGQRISLHDWEVLALEETLSFSKTSSND